MRDQDGDTWTWYNERRGFLIHQVISITCNFKMLTQLSMCCVSHICLDG